LKSFGQQLDATTSVLELACGNRLWTPFLAPKAQRLVAVDAPHHPGAMRRSPLAAGTHCA
jgi:hypothetical protein